MTTTPTTPTTMLKNIHPLLTGSLLDTLRGLRPGQHLALVSTDEVHVEPGFELDASIEDAADAILSVLPVSDEVDAPIEYWLEDADDVTSQDTAYAVVGIARDAELRPLHAEEVSARIASEATADAALVVRVHGQSPAAAFLVRVGGAESRVHATAAA